MSCERRSSDTLEEPGATSGAQEEAGLRMDDGSSVEMRARAGRKGREGRDSGHRDADGRPARARPRGKRMKIYSTLVNWNDLRSDRPLRYADFLPRGYDRPEPANFPCQQIGSVHIFMDKGTCPQRRPPLSPFRMD